MPQTNEQMPKWEKRYRTLFGDQNVTEQITDMQIGFIQGIINDVRSQAIREFAERVEKDEV